jgi:hypothetical protein
MFKFLDELSFFENKIIESMSVKVSYPDKKSVIISSVYRSNGTLQNVTPSQQIDRFLEKFSELLSLLRNTKLDAYVCMDSNIYLLKLNQPNARNFLNLIFEKVFYLPLQKQQDVSPTVRP